MSKTTFHSIKNNVFTDLNKKNKYCPLKALLRACLWDWSMQTKKPFNNYVDKMRMGGGQKMGDIQWLRGQEEVAGGQKISIFVHV